MNIEKLLSYKHIDYKDDLNKIKFPQSNLTWLDYKEFNEIYAWAKATCIEGESTPSKGIAKGPKNRYHSFYLVFSTVASIELIICHIKYGCYKFVVRNKKSEDNSINGIEAARTIIKTAKSFDVFDTFKNINTSKEQGLEIKKQIESPIIRTESDIYENRVFEHCYHLDANSSYASRIIERWPELTKMYQWIYKRRKENDGYFKHVLTNSIGCFQSPYCPNIDNTGLTTPYALSEIAKEAVNGTNQFINNYIAKLYVQGYKPLLINTDGIWYQSDKGPFKDDKEGYNLGEWKHDHKDVTLYIKSAGAYQYIEDNKVNTVLRGYCALDKVKPNRDTWTWKEIENQTVFKLEFNKERGIIVHGN